jgi:hypothetical protein
MNFTSRYTVGGGLLATYFDAHHIVRQTELTLAVRMWGGGRR